MGRPKKIIPEKSVEQKAEDYQKLQAKWASEDLQEEKEIVDDLAKDSAEKRAADAGKKEADIQSRKAAAKKAFDEYLKTPLSEKEKVEFDFFLSMANSSRTPPDPIMRKIYEYRVRSKNNGVKNPG